MGAYLSEPVTEKLSNDETNAAVDCGASCMQGWRINQEDAHNTILDYDKNTMLFSVYDGHGGAEVAAYCAQKLPDYIKQMEAYKNGDLVKALEDAFLGFDALIATKEVMDVLKEMAGKGQLNPPPDETGDTSEEDDEDECMSNLFQEAQLPLREVLAKYENHCNAALRAKLGDNATPLSPCLRAKKNKDTSDEGASSSSAGACSSRSRGSKEQGGKVEAEGACSSGASSSNAKPEDVDVSSTSSNKAEKDLNGEVTTSDTDKSIPKAASNPKENVPDSSGDTGEQPGQSGTPGKSEALDQCVAPGKGETTCNGQVTAGKSAEENNITSSNGDSNTAKDKETAEGASLARTGDKKEGSALRRAMMKTLLLAKAGVVSDDTDSSEGEESSSDETYEVPEGNGASDSSNEEGEEEEGEGEEEGSSDEEYDHDMNMTEEPGSDSGCTAVVALLRDNQLYVGNAGDSRCIVCREGVAVDMSIDHKPEDALELERITKAGGKVSNDGRINGGLNLSRAIGDHSYKQNKQLNDKEQMITALPDVKTLTIDPEKDEFMLLACDGIWNFMSSQDVCDFISPRLKEGRERLSQICEEMFDHCLAPNTVGDGTGCDNMTAILVTFKKGASGNAEVASVSTTDCAKKRSAEEQSHEEAKDPKRQKVEDTLSSSVVTSSV